MARVELRLPLWWVTIVPSGGAAGQTMGGPLPMSVGQWMEERTDTLPLRIRDRVEREVMAKLAGEVAQERATGTTEGSAVLSDDPRYGQILVDGDWKRASELLSVIASDEAVLPYSQLLRIWTEHLLNRPWTWLHVEAVAQALLDRDRLTRRDVVLLRPPATSYLSADLQEGLREVELEMAASRTRSRSALTRVEGK